MFQKLVNHNPDIQRLVEKGCAITFDSNCMVVRDIPYLDNNRDLQIGAIVTKLVFIDQERVTQEDHQIYFAGSHPHNIDGTPIPNLGGGSVQFPLSEACSDVVVQRSFSNKPKQAGQLVNFVDFFEKIESYITIISGPAIELHKANPYTFKIVDKIMISDSVFKFHDTLSSKAEITDLSLKFKNDVVAVIGLGGTGAYILDFLVKTPVKEIRAFDFDAFHVHNAFRSPGRLLPEELGLKKAEVYSSRYENFRHGLSVTAMRLDDTCTENFDGVTFAFVCIDSGSSRSVIFDMLIAKGIPFIDVGMGLNRKRGPISGMLRTTYYSAENGIELRNKNLAPLTDNPNDAYKTNIQIGELNALNACLAVIKFKQLRGFYFDDSPYSHFLFDVGDLSNLGNTSNADDKQN